MKDVFSVEFCTIVLKSSVGAEVLVFLVSALLFYSIFILSGSLTISKSEVHELEKDSKREEERKRERK